MSGEFSYKNLTNSWGSVKTLLPQRKIDSTPKQGKTSRIYWEQETSMTRWRLSYNRVTTWENTRYATYCGMLSWQTSKETNLNIGLLSLWGRDIWSRLKAMEEHRIIYYFDVFAIKTHHSLTWPLIYDRFDSPHKSDTKSFHIFAICEWPGVIKCMFFFDNLV